MSKVSLEILTKVVDYATGPLKGVQREVDNTSKSIKKAGFDLIQFNRVMFSTTAFLGLFERGFSKISDAMLKGAQLDRVETQFEAVLGPKGSLFNSISQFTDNSIDKIEAMKAGIALRSTGITSNVDQIAELVARAGTAAKKAGLDSAEGIKRFTQFMKDGSVSNLEFLNLIAGTNPALQAQMAILHRTGGAMGQVLMTQHKLALGQGLLRAATENSLKGQRDLYDTLFDIGQAFTFLKSDLGKFVGTALQPLLEGVTKLFTKFSAVIQDIKDNKKEILFLAKVFTIATAGVVGLVAGLGSLNLAVKGLAFLGIGIPALAASVLALGSIFFGVTKDVNGFVNKLEFFGKFAKGIFELVSSFNRNTGISQINKDLKDILEQQGLYNFVKNISRAIILVKEFGRGLKDSLLETLISLDDKFASITNRIMKLLGFSGQSWSKNWINSANNLGKVFGKLLAGFFALRAARTVLGLGAGLRRTFSGGRGPSGSKGDPLYVTDTSKLGVAGILGGKLIPDAGKGDGIVASLGAVNRVLRILGSGLMGLVRIVGIIGAVVGAAATIQGLFTGIVANIDQFKQLGTSIANFTSAVIDTVDNFLKTNEWTKKAYTAIKSGAEILIQLPKTLYSMLLEGVKGFVGVLGFGAGKIGAYLDNMTLQLNQGLASKQTPGLTTSQMGIGASGQITTVPSMPASEAEKMSFLDQTKSALDLEHSKKLQTAMSWAMQGTSAGGTEITQQEWVTIFKTAMDQATVTKHIETTAKNTKPRTIPANAKRGNC